MTPRESYKKAVEIEEAGIALYSRLVALLPDGSREQEEIEFLLEQETYHRSFYEEEMEKYPAVHDAEAEDNQSGTEIVLEEVEAALSSGIPGSAREALLLGVKLEKGSIAYFQRLSKNAPPGYIKKAIKRILQEEKEHLQRLNLLLEL